MIYAYAIAEPGTAGPAVRGRRGLGGAALRVIEHEGLAAVCSRHRSLRAEPSRTMLLTHERVAEAVMDEGAVLPLRFGTMLEDEKRLQAVLAARRDELLQALARVRGRVEIGVRALARRPPDGAPRGHERSGREYMLSRLRDHRRADEAARTLHAPLAALACDSRLRAAPPPAALASAYLVDRVRVGEFRARVEELAAGRDDLDVVVTGPWPPYSFVGEEDGS